MTLAIFLVLEWIIYTQNEGKRSRFFRGFSFFHKSTRRHNDHEPFQLDVFNWISEASRSDFM